MESERKIQKLMASERKWEDLNRDCLVDIFARVVRTKELAKSIPFVCKSWYDATLDPHCWKSLLFCDRYTSDGYVEFVVARSQRSATSVVIRRGLSFKALSCIAEGCPALEILHLPPDIYFNQYSTSYITELLVKFTPKIKQLILKSSYLLRSHLITVLKGCRELEVLDVSDCIGFQADDVEILNLASHIKSFNCTGSRVVEDRDDDSTDSFEDPPDFDL